MGNKIMSSRAFVDEKYTRPQSVYDLKDGDYRKLRRLILNGQLAPCFPGAEECTSELDECPICFLFYPSLNKSRCCSKAICTECYLQIKSAHFARSTQCPFCKTSSYTVEYRGAKTVAEKCVEQAEEQKVIEAMIRIRQMELHDEEERVRRLGEDTQAEPLEHETNHMLMEPGEPGMSAQAAHMQGSPHRLNRNDGFDLDMEDMMLMEAIWLSIQEQGQLHQDFPLAQQIHSSTALSEKGIFDSNQIRTEIAGRCTAPGGLTRAIAALAERQATTAENRVGDQVVNSSQNFMESPSRIGLYRRKNQMANRALQKEKQDVPWEKQQNGERNWQNASCGNEELNGWLNTSKESGRTFCSSVQREDREFTFDWGLDQSSASKEAGTSFSFSIPSASDVPWESPDLFSSEAKKAGTSFSFSIPSASESPDLFSSGSSDNVGETSLSIASARLLPVSFEEQIMLAMALSLAEAQPQARRQ